MIRLIPMLILLMPLIWQTSLQAATYHTAQTGSDATACANADFATTARAKLTIQAGMNCLGAGDTLIIHQGDYVENDLRPPVSGTSAARITVRAASGGDAPSSSTLPAGPGLCFLWLPTMLAPAARPP
jgi:hypothetical protein